MGVGSQRDVRGQRIRLHDNGFAIVRNEDTKNPAEELPGSFAGFDGARGGFLERGIDEPIARENGGKDPGTKMSALL